MRWGIIRDMVWEEWPALPPMDAIARLEAPRYRIYVDDEYATISHEFTVPIPDWLAPSCPQLEPGRREYMMLPVDYVHKDKYLDNPSAVLESGWIGLEFMNSVLELPFWPRFRMIHATYAFVEGLRWTPMDWDRWVRPRS